MTIINLLSISSINLEHFEYKYTLKKHAIGKGAKQDIEDIYVLGILLNNTRK